MTDYLEIPAPLQHILSPNDINKMNMVAIKHVFTRRGKRALEEGIISPAQILETQNFWAFEILFTPFGQRAMREKLLSPLELTGMTLGSAKKLFTFNGLQALKEKLITIEEVIQINWDFLLEMLFTNQGLHALRTKQLIPTQFIGLNEPEAKRLLLNTLPAASMPLQLSSTGFFNYKNSPLKKTPQKKSTLQAIFQMALQHTNNTCILGASNRFRDVKRSNGWSFVNQERNTQGEYSKLFNWKDKNYTLSFSSDEPSIKFKDKESLWYYHPQTESSELVTSSYGVEKPLDDPKFNLSDEAKLILGYSMVAREGRWGNCGIRAALVTKYLWEHASNLIKRIELIELANEDHSIVVVNRGGDDLQNPQTWGNDCWIVDAWWTSKGKIYPASEFKEQINCFKKYKAAQERKLNNIGLTAPKKDKSEFEFRLYVEIVPQRDCYPTYDKNKTIDNYYFIISDYSKDFQNNIDRYKDQHQNKFNKCLKEIENQFNIDQTMTC